MQSVTSNSKNLIKLYDTAKLMFAYDINDTLMQCEGSMWCEHLDCKNLNYMQSTNGSSSDSSESTQLRMLNQIAQ